MILFVAGTLFFVFKDTSEHPYKGVFLLQPSYS